MDVLSASARLHAVQIIGQEAILCGQVLSMGTSAVCLVHAKVRLPASPPPSSPVGRSQYTTPLRVINNGFRLHLATADRIVSL